MVKAYLRYEQEAAFGVVTSAPALAYAPGGGLLATGSLEAVAVWDARTGTLVRSLEPARSASGAVAGEVTALAAASGPAVASPAADGGATAAACLASGHADGKVRLWSWSSSDCDACLTGHGSAVTALAFDADGSTLASGGADTDIVLWDVAAGEGQFRLRAHVGQVTGLAFLAGRRGLASTSKDGALRLWDLGARACVQTVVVLSGEVRVCEREVGVGGLGRARRPAASAHLPFAQTPPTFCSLHLHLILALGPGPGPKRHPTGRCRLRPRRRGLFGGRGLRRRRRRRL